MTAAAVVRASSQTGMRAVDPRRDLAGLADVIESAFADSLDASGRHMASEMRRYGRLGWLGWLIGRLVLPPAAFPFGYVWIEQGRIVGNASLMPVQASPERWVLANVAVDPHYRRRGIGRALVGGCLDLARRRLAREVVLQVKAGNALARELYQAYDFVERGTYATWRLDGPVRWPAVQESAPARLRRPEEWSAHYELARTWTPLGLVWPHPLRRSQLRPASWTSVDPWTHWVWPKSGPIEAVLSGRPEGGNADRWFLVSAPGARGAAELPLLEQALTGHRHGAVVVEAAAGAGDEALRRLGFREDHRLTWMSLGLQPAAGAAP